MVYLITGKSGAGKTHYAKALAAELREDGKQVKVLDGDWFREQTHNNDFSNEGRQLNLIHAAVLARMIEKQGFIAIVAFVAPKKKWRNQMRTFWQQSKVIYLPGGSLWANTTYEKPDAEEL